MAIYYNKLRYMLPIIPLLYIYIYIDTMWLSENPPKKFNWWY